MSRDVGEACCEIIQCGFIVKWHASQICTQSDVFLRSQVSVSIHEQVKLIKEIKSQKKHEMIHHAQLIYIYFVVVKEGG